MTLSRRSAGRLAAGVVTMAIAAVAASPAAAADRNHDRIPDRWEVKNHLSLSQNQARKDQDSDGLRNRGEFLANMDPRNDDTDGDGVEDGTEGAGTVSSFDSSTGKLVINLFSGDSVSGTVTPDTEIECNNDDDVQPDDHGDDPAGDDHGHDGPGHEGDDDHSAPGGGGDDDPSGDDDKRDHGDDDASCSSADLAPGTVVREAELDVTSSGLVFEEIELL